MFRRVTSSFWATSSRNRGTAASTATASTSPESAGTQLRFSAAVHRFVSAPRGTNSIHWLAASTRSFSTATSAATTTTPIPTSPLDEFRDKVPRQQRMNEPVGRPWSVKELRRKSYDDLHKLWYVLYKERNMLLTELQLSRRRGIIFPQPERMKKVQKSMGAIRQVLGERKREKIAAFKKQQQQPKSDEEEAMNFHE